MTDRLYDKDFNLWIERESKYLRNGNTEKLDLENILEEIEALGKRDRRALESQIVRLLHHLLKWVKRPERRGSSWQLTIINSRDEISKLLEDSPSLEKKIESLFEKCYTSAVKNAMVETGLKKKDFPKESSWSLREILEEDFWPEVLNC